MGGSSFVAQLSYTHDPSAGVSYGMPENQRYRKIDQLSLLNNNLWPGYRSGRLRKSWQSGAELILFFGSTSAWEIPYRNQFIQWSRRSDMPTAWGNFAGIPVGKGLTSALLVATAFNGVSEIRVAMGTTVLPLPELLGGPNTILGAMQAQIDDSLSNEVWRNGAITCNWNMWPGGVSHLISTGWYLRFVVRLRTDPLGTWSKTYDASITMDVRFFRDSNGRIRASGDRWATWCENGALQQRILDELNPAADNALDNLHDTLNLILGLIGGNDAIDHYLLPGAQASANLQVPFVWQPVTFGDTTQDATLVLEMPG